MYKCDKGVFRELMALTEQDLESKTENDIENEHKKDELMSNDGDEKRGHVPQGLLDDPTLFPEGGLRAYLVLVGSFLGLIGSLAFCNSVGAVESYIKEHILIKQPTSTVAWIFSIYNFMEFGMSLITGPIFDKVGARIPISIGICLFAIGIMTMSILKSIYQFILSFSVCAGLGSSFTFSPFVSVLSHYFYKKRGQAVGIAYIGGSIGGVFMPLVFKSLFDKVGFGWTIRIGGFICLVFLIIGLILVEDRNKVFCEAREPKQNLIVEIIKSIDIGVFKDQIFTMLVLSLLGNGFAFLITMTYLPSYAVKIGYPESKSYLLLTVFNSLSIPGRLLPGFLADKFGPFNILCCISIMSSVSFIVIWFPHPVGHNIIGLYIFLAMYGFSSGSFLLLTPTCIGVLSKTKDFGKRCGTAFFVLSFGDLFGIVIGGAIIGKGNLKNYDHMVIFVMICSLIATTCVITSRIRLAKLGFGKKLIC